MSLHNTGEALLEDSHLEDSPSPKGCASSSPARGTSEHATTTTGAGSCSRRDRLAGGSDRSLLRGSGNSVTGGHQPPNRRYSKAELLLSQAVESWTRVQNADPVQTLDNLDALNLNLCEAHRSGGSVSFKQEQPRFRRQSSRMLGQVRGGMGGGGTGAGWLAGRGAGGAVLPLPP